jgi:hypothetical protein
LLGRASTFQEGSTVTPRAEDALRLIACFDVLGTEPADIKAKLKADLIDGELEELKVNLKQAETSFKLKSAYALSLGSLVAIIGSITGIVSPPVAFGLAATISATSLSPGVSRYVDDKVKIESDDMYFLLQAEAHRH